MFGDRMLRTETLKPKSVGATLARFSKYFRPLLVGSFLCRPTHGGKRLYPGNRPGTDRPGSGTVFLAPSAFGGDGAGGGGLQLPAGTDLQSETDSQANCWYAPDLAASDSSRADLLRGLLNITLVITGYYVIGSVTGGLMFFSMSWTGHNVLRALRVRLFKPSSPPLSRLLYPQRDRRPDESASPTIQTQSNRSSALLSCRF